MLYSRTAKILGWRYTARTAIGRNTVASIRRGWVWLAVWRRLVAAYGRDRFSRGRRHRRLEPWCPRMCERRMHEG